MESGMLLYTRNRFPAWRGGVFIGSMMPHHFNQLVIEDGHVVLEERLMYGKGTRSSLNLHYRRRARTRSS